MKLRIYSHNNRFCFAIDGFSSMHHYFLSPSVKSSYASAWEANRDARKLLGVHAEAMKEKRYAFEDMSKPVVMDASADEMMTNHYKEIANILRQRSIGQEDEPDERKIMYEEIKAVVSEIMTVDDALEDEKQKSELKVILNQFRELVQDKYKDLLDKDKKEKEEAEAPDPAMVPDGLGPDGMPPDPMMPDGGIPPMPLTASKNDFPCIEKDVREEMMDEYGGYICKAVQKHHPNCIYKINGDIIDICDTTPILSVEVNENLNVDNIMPCGKLREVYPLKSARFYQRYWKPIVESVGHVLLKDEGVLLASAKISLPDMPNNNKDCNLTGWDVNEDKEVDITLSFVGDNLSWIFKKGLEKTAASKFTQEEILSNQPARVRCIDEQLSSIYGKYGEVVEIIPFDSHAEYDINFGRKIVRLTEDQFELSHELPPIS